jgi:multiple sugar transport system permease protein
VTAPATDAPRAAAEALLRSPGPVRRRVAAGPAVRWLVLFAGGVAMVAPLAYMLSTSLKYPFEVYNLNLIPEEPTLDNYRDVLSDRRFGWWFFNSLLVATLTTVSNLFWIRSSATRLRSSASASGRWCSSRSCRP